MVGSIKCNGMGDAEELGLGGEIDAGHGAPARLHSQLGMDRANGNQSKKFTKNVTTTLYNGECNLPYLH